MFARPFIAAAIVAALTAASAIAFLPTEADALPAGAKFHQAGQGFAYDFGSKHVVGYFQPKDGTCALTVVLSEREERVQPGTGAALRVAVSAGEATELQSGEGAGLRIQCGPSAGAITVAPFADGA